MLSRINLLSLRKASRISRITLLKRAYTSYRTEKSFDHYPLQHPVDLKNYSHKEFDIYHKKVYKKVFGEEMPPDHLQNPEFTVFEINRVRRLFWRYYYTYYKFLSGLLCSAFLIYHFDKYLKTYKYQKEGNLERIEARFMENMERFDKKDVLEEYKEFKEKNELKFSRNQADVIFDNDYVGFKFSNFYFFCSIRVIFIIFYPAKRLY